MITGKQRRQRRYLDKARHGSKRQELLDKHGPKCSICGLIKNEIDIVAHHITGNPEEHEWQVLLCRSCHAKLHLPNIDKKKIPESVIRKTIEICPNLDESAKVLGLSRAGLALKRKKYGIKPKCEYCQNEFKPTRRLRAYCSEECQKSGIQKKYLERIERVDPERKKEFGRADYAKHREERLAKVKAYYKTNAEKIKAYAREYHRKKKQQ